MDFFRATPKTQRYSAMPPRAAQDEWSLFVLQERPLAMQAVMGGARLNNTPAVGWHRACVARRDGSKADVYYAAPDGTQMRSRNDVSRWIEIQPKVAIVEMEGKAFACARNTYFQFRPRHLS